jgi:4-diphosphocytidyl-2-C-methyl-D-erythritol kinase
VRLPRLRDEDAPPRWRALAPGKVNLSLLLGGTRPDGRHELVTVFESVSLADELELTVRDAGPDEVVCPGIEGLNLAATALERLRAAGWEGPPVRVTITKWIPVAGGMAGGSADAAATLRLADAVHPIDPSLLSEIAAGLGADVPSQLTPGVSLGTGAGETVAPAERLADHRYVIVPLGAELATPAVFAEADRLGLGRSPDALTDGRRRLTEALAAGGGRLPAQWLVNDLEPASRSLCSGIGPALDASRAAGADVAMVCGSGPTVAALFWGEEAAERAADAEAALAGRYPEAYRAEPVQAAFGAPQRL